MSSSLVMHQENCLLLDEAAFQFGVISRETAEEILFDSGCIDGMFLVRESTANDSVLSLCHNQSILHYRISRIPSTGQVILHGTPIQVFPDFETLILKVQGLPIKPTIVCDRNNHTRESRSSVYSSSSAKGRQILQQTPQPHRFFTIQRQRPQQQAIYAGDSFYGTHIHYHRSHRSSQPSSQLNNCSTLNNQLNNQMNGRSNSMWRLPLPDIKEAIIKKTKELGDELVYDTSSTSGPKFISNGNEAVKQVQTVQAEVHIQRCQDIKLTPCIDNNKTTLSTTTSSHLSTLEQLDMTSSLKALSNPDSTASEESSCSSCHEQVKVVSSSDQAAVLVNNNKSGLICRGCRKAIHFSCDSVTETESVFFSKMRHRFICKSCLEILEKKNEDDDNQLSKKTKETSSSTTDAEHKSWMMSKADGDQHHLRTEVIPSRQEMKEMIKEVVDDVIRSTITQVITEKILPQAASSTSVCLNCHSESSESDTSSGGDNKTMPSVTTLDKEAEEQSKNKTKTEKELLLLLKSPDVEVKHFFPKNGASSCKTTSSSTTKTTAETTTTVLPTSNANTARIGGHQAFLNQIVSSDEIELKKKEILQLLQDKKKKEEEPPKKEAQVPVMSSSIKESVVSIKDDDDDNGDYESIRFDRDHLDPKSCLGFANLDHNLQVKRTPETTSDVRDEGEDDQDREPKKCNHGMTTTTRTPIKLNQVDLICLEEENQEKIQEMVRIYKKGPVSLDPKFITLRYKIGSGFFGEVFLATIPLRTPSNPISVAKESTTSSSNNVYSNSPSNYIQVAVKVLKDSSLFNSRAELMREASVMATLDHKHILRLIGVACEDQSLKTPFMMVLELAPLGPMSSFLQSPAGQDMPLRGILVLMLQVAMGMQFLESKNYVHRDLAARNVLLVNESFAKISDFGMSKALGLGKDYYQARSGSKWPLKWFAPECIYFYKFSIKSDVWAFGITLWEGLSHGSRPYEGMDSESIMRFLNANGQQQRLPPPKGTPEPIRELMAKCWSYRPEDRPNFGHIVQTLTSFLFLPNNSSTTTTPSTASQ